MSERFEKTYISVSEFISSWEKEIYELTNLDYFTFILINTLGYKIEHEFFSKEPRISYLHIDPDEIGTLAFNLGDGLESFLENNCFGDCSLSCPIKLNEKINPDNTDLLDGHLHILQIVSGDDVNKKQILLTDILNYVVLDTLFDFYNYEIGLELDDADVGLMHLADFITTTVEKFIESNDQRFLKFPKESASDLFESLIQENDDNWDESLKSSFDDDTEEIEIWKYGKLGIPEVVQEYLSYSEEKELKCPHEELLIGHFRDYTEKYIGIKKIDEITSDDLEEFFLFWLLREIVLEKNIPPQSIKRVFSDFFKWLELSREIDLIKPFQKIISQHFSGLQDALVLTRRYFEDNSIIQGILEVNASDSQIFSGLFEVEKIAHTGFVHLRDIHFKKRYLNVQINFPSPLESLDNKIIDASIKPTAYGWRLVNLEYIYPKTAKTYLH